MNNIYLFFICFAFLVRTTCAQESKSEDLGNQFKMNFPGIYFRHNSLEYAPMPYTVDSCMKYIAENFDDNINSLVIWRDSAETEVLVNKRIQKLQAQLRKHIRNRKCEIYSMGDNQKISRYTISQTKDKAQSDYLLSLNSVFEISKTRVDHKIKIKNHIMRPRITCWSCWKSGFHLQSRMKFKKMEKRNKNDRKK